MNETNTAGIQWNPSYHYPHGASIAFEEVILNEECYVNPEPESRCPRCGETAVLRHSEGPVRTHRHLWKVMGRVYKCRSQTCKGSAYVCLEVID